MEKLEKPPSTRDILSILDNLENKLNRHQMPLSIRSNYQLYSNNINNPGLQNQPNYTYRNNIIQDTQPINSSNEYYIRKLINEEFSSLIIPYQQDLHNNINILETKINNNTTKIKELSSNNLDNITNLLNKGGLGNFSLGESQHLMNNDKYILKFEFENKIAELEQQITTINGYVKSLGDIVNSKNMENMKKMNDDLKRMSDYENLNKNNYLDKNDFEYKMNEMQNQFNKLYEDMNNFQNVINSLNQFKGQIKANDNKLNELNNELSSLKNDLNNLNYDYNGFKNQIDINSINNIKSNMNQFAYKNDFKNIKNSISEVQEMKTDLDNLNSELNELKNNVDLDFLGRIKSILNQCVNTTELNIVKNSIKNLENKINNMNLNNDNNINNNNNNFNNNNEDLTDLENKINQINNELNILKNTSDNSVISKTKINQHDTQINNLSEKLSQIYEELNRDINEINSKISELENKIKQCPSGPNEIYSDGKKVIKSSNYKASSIREDGNENINNNFTSLKVSNLKDAQNKIDSNFQVNSLNSEIDNNGYNIGNKIENNSKNNMMYNSEIDYPYPQKEEKPKNQKNEGDDFDIMKSENNLQNEGDKREAKIGNDNNQNPFGKNVNNNQENKISSKKEDDENKIASIELIDDLDDLLK